MKSYEDIVKELDSKIPREVVAERSGGNGRSLSYLEGWYVIDRLNKIVGQGNWGYEIKELKNVFVGQDNKQRHTTSYIAQVSFWAKLKPTQTAEGHFNYSGEARFDEVGYGDGLDATSAGKAHELAVKEAVTDGLKRAAKNLGPSTGLALYDKSQAMVEEHSNEKGTKASNTSSTISGNGSTATNGATDHSKAAQGTTNGAAKRATGSSNSTRETKLKLIAATAKAVVAKGSKSAEDIRTLLTKEFLVSFKEDLTDAQAAKFLATLETYLQPTQ